MDWITPSLFIEPTENVPGRTGDRRVSVSVLIGVSISPVLIQGQMERFTFYLHQIQMHSLVVTTFKFIYWIHMENHQVL